MSDFISFQAMSDYVPFDDELMLYRAQLTPPQRIYHTMRAFWKSIERAEPDAEKAADRMEDILTGAFSPAVAGIFVQLLIDIERAQEVDEDTT